MFALTKWQVFPKEASFSEEELTWINNSGLMYDLENPDKMTVYDSGWCDYSTGYEIVTSRHKLFVTTSTPKQETWLKLYWEDRAVMVAQTLDAV